MTFAQLKDRYHDLLLSETKRRMCIFRTFPSKHFDLAKKTELEDNATCMDDKVRKDNILINQNHYYRYGPSLVN